MEKTFFEKLETNLLTAKQKGETHAPGNLNEEIASRSASLFEPDFKIYADRGSNCFKNLDGK